ncbi:MAG TPA: 2-phospho-L-lactate transferase [Acidimicrobiales bacterium]|nr:2-phospho-L-lactate transferase [Acidimicrobiales bacterium]
MGRVAVLAGGVGAARLLRGMVEVVPPADVTAIVNTGDDMVLHGLAISPDIDTVTYTVADAIDPERGWGLRDESWHAMEALSRYSGVTWFRLGDRDLATHMFRTQRLAEGAGLAAVTAEVTRSWALDLRVVPVTEQPLRTMITLAADEGCPTAIGAGVAAQEISFQDYFVRLQHAVPVAAVRFAGVASARPAPGVLEAIAGADTVVVAPSNPIVSIGPVMAVPGIRDAVTARRDDVVAVSPLVGGRALKGPADRLLRELGHEDSVVGIARLYAPFVGALVIDEADGDLADDVRAAGLRCVVTDTIMRDPAAAAALCQVVLGR